MFRPVNSSDGRRPPLQKANEVPLGFTTRGPRWTRVENNTRGNRISPSRKSKRRHVASPLIGFVAVVSYNNYQFSAALADAGLVFRVVQGGFDFFLEQHRERE